MPASSCLTGSPATGGLPWAWLPLWVELRDCTNQKIVAARQNAERTLERLSVRTGRLLSGCWVMRACDLAKETGQEERERGGGEREREDARHDSVECYSSLHARPFTVGQIPLP